jgi:Kdo2-lipid IVA lauroyltransferase/acyltransferase
MKYIEFLLLRGTYAMVSRLPFSWLYGLSDILSAFLQYVIRYRLKVVTTNLKKSFPEKSEAEIKHITREFYTYLCDNFLESIKGYSLSTEKLMKRYYCVNPEVGNQFFAKGQNIIIALSHYANWEWGTQVASSVYTHNVATFYKPMSNKYIDKYFQELRNRRSMEVLSAYEIHRIGRKNGEIPKSYFMVSDQSPSSSKKAYWTTFLNQDTACIRGIESYAKLFNLPVIYLDVQKVKRGYYVVEMDMLCENPAQTKQGEITDLYMKKLESIIVRNPENWLWSHRRWKIKKDLKLQNQQTSDYTQQACNS